MKIKKGKMKNRKINFLFQNLALSKGTFCFVDKAKFWGSTY